MTGGIAVELAAYVAAVRAGQGDSAATVGEFRRTRVLVPLVDGSVWSAVQNGIHWLHAFTSEGQLAAFARARGAGPPQPEWEYATMLGARLLDVLIPQVEGSAGVALDVADEDGSMLLPPVRGIVPDAVAVDMADERDAGEDTDGRGRGPL